MMPANVKLSKTELALVCNEEFILTKNKIITKVYEMFGLLSTEFQKELIKAKAFLADEILLQSPKIYKGEQYKSLPYVMLDQPRCFHKNDAFAVRCFFWWGNFFSITLHVAGKYKTLYAPGIMSHLSANSIKNNWHYCINENQWQHDFDGMNYKSISQNKELIKIHYTENNFIKIATQIPLNQWEDAYDFYIKCFKEILSFIQEEKKDFY